MSELHRLQGALDEAVQNGVAPAMVLLLWRNGKAQTLAAGKADAQTVFDLASLTKPLCTAVLALDLQVKGIISRQDSLSGLWGDAVPEDKRGITVHQLLSHSSGLPAYQPYYTALNQRPRAQRKGFLKAMLMNEPLQDPPGSKALYSDLGYMLLGLIMEQRLGLTLDSGLAKQYEALEIEGPRFLPLDQELPWPLERIAPCGPLPGRPLIHGQVEDENAYAMGGVAPHAGLFGTAGQVASVMHAVCKSLRDGRAWPREQTAALFELDKAVAGSGRTPGFDTPQGPESAAGDEPPMGTVGHLGFTGVSFWWHPASNRGVVLLTNRVAHGRDNQKIKPFRNLIHNLAWKELAQS